MKKVYHKQAKQSRKIWIEEKEKVDNRGTVTVELPLPLGELLGNAQETVRELAHRVGLSLIKLTLNEEVKRLVGPYYHPEEKVSLRRWGKQPGYVIWSGKKEKIKRPRVRTKDSGQEVPLRSYEAFQSERGLDESIWKRLILGLSSRDYEPAINDFYEGYGLKKSSISRRFIKASAEKLRQLTERSLAGLDLVVIGIDGLEIAGQVVIIAVGIDSKGKKHILGLWQGATENAEICKNLLEDLVSRGLATHKNYLFVIDGAKALRKAIRDLFGEKELVQRCQLHKRRNVKKHLPEGYQGMVDQRLRVAYNMTDYKEAKELLLKTVEYVKGINPSAARSLEEGLEETLTVHRLGLPDILRKTLSTTNFIESPLGMTRDVIRDVKRWRAGDQIQRWVGSALLDSERRLKRIKGYRSLPILINALNRNLDKTSGVA